MGKTNCLLLPDLAEGTKSIIKILLIKALYPGPVHVLTGYK